MLAEVQLGLGDYAAIGAIQVVVNGILLAYIKSIAGRVDRVEARVGDVEQRVQTQFADVEKKKTDKYEWARETFAARGKLNELGEQIAHLAGRFETNVAFGEAFARLADELAELRKGQTGG